MKLIIKISIGFLLSILFNYTMAQTIPMYLNGNSKIIFLGYANNVASYLDAKSYKTISTKDGLLGSLVIDDYNIPTGIIIPTKYFLSLNQCSQSSGTLMRTDISATQAELHDYTMGSGTLGASVAKLICDAYKSESEYKEKNNQK